MSDLVESVMLHKVRKQEVLTYQWHLAITKLKLERLLMTGKVRQKVIPVEIFAVSVLNWNNITAGYCVFSLILISFMIGDIYLWILRCFNLPQLICS